LFWRESLTHNSFNIGQVEDKKHLKEQLEIKEMKGDQLERIGIKGNEKE